MPEGHLVHRYAREHDAKLRGEPLHVSSPQGRFAAEARVLDGRHLQRAEAWGKHLFHHWDDASIVHVHLGQRGVFLHGPPPAQVLPQARLRLEGSRLVATLIAPARCERLDAAGREAIVARLGPDPLRTDADPERALDAIARSRAPIGALLLDQRVIAGVGNVLRAEALSLCRIAPTRAGRELSRERAEALWTTLVELMRRAAEDGRILTAVSEGADRASIPEEETRLVYRQLRCRRCGEAIDARPIGGRTAYSCPRCQPD